MGIHYESATVLCNAFKAGVCFHRTLMLGRLRCYLTASQIRSLARHCGVAPYDPTLERELYVERLFRTLFRAEEVSAIDVSDYQGADVIHDMNLPVPPSMEESCDVVIDGGTLQHVFNFPVAIENAMRLVRPGGRLFIFTNGNNFMGEGLYQFSPDVFYRVLSEGFGFEVERMLAVQYKFVSAECGSVGPVYEVKDPASISERIVVCNSRPLGLLIQARKYRPFHGFVGKFPQESRYVTEWANPTDQRRASPSEDRAKPGGGVKRLLLRMLGYLPANAEAAIRSRYRRCRDYFGNHYSKHRIHGLTNRRHFIPLASSTSSLTRVLPPTFDHGQCGKDIIAKEAMRGGSDDE